MAMIVSKIPLVTTLIAVLGLGGCATPGGGAYSTANSGTLNCNPGFAAAAGAIIGGLLANGNNRVRGAALGAGIASLACVGWNYHVRQTKSAAQVQEEYKAANGGELPAQDKVVRFDTQIEPTSSVSPGGKVNVVSNIEVAQGTSDKNLVVEEELIMLLPDHSEVKSRKRANENQGPGAFSTTYTLTMPQGVPQGIYPLHTALYVNGNKVSENNLQMQVVWMQRRDTVAGL